MGCLKGLVDSFSALFSGARPSATSVPSPSPVAASDRTMDGSAEGPPLVSGPPVVSDRVVLKLKGYFELAKEEVEKAVRAEEWGLAEDAITHYRNAQRVMFEASTASIPDALSPSGDVQVKAYQQKISRWQEQVAERLQVLSQRRGTEPKKATTSHTLVRTISLASGAKKPMPQCSSSLKNSPTTLNQEKGNGSAKLAQDAMSGYDARLVEIINTVIVDRSPAVKWDDVAGLEKAKQALMEMVILPSKRKDLFIGLRKPARGLLLFGPPGNGKTMLAKAVASESEATFFSISASSLTSKWVGEAEKLVRTLFMIAVDKQPSVIFMDEIDSIMSARLVNENDASRRLKSEFLIQFDGVTSNQNDLVIVIGATNKPQELDDAVLRRLVKRIYIPLPDENVRRLLLRSQLKGRAFSLPSGDLERLIKETKGYSGSDLQALCEEAAMMPIRELGPQNILNIEANQVRPLRYDDFWRAMVVIRPSLHKSRWEELEKWNKQFGSN